MTTSHTGRSGKLHFAWLITEVLAPPHLVLALLLLVGVSSTGDLRGAGWGLLAGAFAGVLPIWFIRRGVRRGRITDRHIAVRDQRIVPLAFAVVSVVVGLVLLSRLGAPGDIMALALAMLAGLAVVLAVTAWWKVSVHTAVAAGTSMITTLVFGWALLVTAVMVVVIGWSRVVLKGHSPAQVIVGGLLGAAVAALVFTACR